MYITPDSFSNINVHRLKMHLVTLFVLLACLLYARLISPERIKFSKTIICNPGAYGTELSVISNIQSSVTCAGKCAAHGWSCGSSIYHAPTQTCRINSAKLSSSQSPCGNDVVYIHQPVCGFIILHACGLS